MSRYFEFGEEVGQGGRHLREGVVRPQVERMDDDRAEHCTLLLYSIYRYIQYSMFIVCLSVPKNTATVAQTMV